MIVMKENNDKRISTISKADTIEGIAAYWEEHSLADHWNETREAHFEVRAKQRQRPPVVLDSLELELLREAKRRNTEMERDPSTIVTHEELLRKLAEKRSQKGN
jgi:hypothetical protein